MVNAGAIVVASLLRSHESSADRFDYVSDSLLAFATVIQCKVQTIKRFQALAGREFIGFSNTTFLSERGTADRNFALAYYMREHGCFPKNTNLQVY